MSSGRSTVASNVWYRMKPQHDRLAGSSWMTRKTLGTTGIAITAGIPWLRHLRRDRRRPASGRPWARPENGFTLLSADDDREVRAVCRERGLGYTPFSPLAGGVLTGKYVRGEPFPEGTRMALRPEAHAEMMTDAVHDALDRLRGAAAAHSVSCG